MIIPSVCVSCHPGCGAFDSQGGLVLHAADQHRHVILEGELGVLEPRLKNTWIPRDIPGDVLDWFWIISNSH